MQGRWSCGEGDRGRGAGDRGGEVQPSGPRSSGQPRTNPSGTGFLQTYFKRSHDQAARAPPTVPTGLVHGVRVPEASSPVLPNGDEGSRVPCTATHSLTAPARARGGDWGRARLQPGSAADVGRAVEVISASLTDSEKTKTNQKSRGNDVFPLV